MSAPRLDDVPHEVRGLPVLPARSPSEEVDEQIEKALASSARARGMLRKAPAGPTVVVRPKNLGRVTGFVVVCSEDGAMDVAAPSRSSGIEAAKDHLRQVHGGKGTVDARGLAAVGKKRGSRGRR